MANSLPPSLATGTVGELLVQLRLLQFGVQAAPPLRDTGNDLVAFRDRTVRTLQVKTATNRISRDRRLPGHYDVLAIVLLHSSGGVVSLDSSRLFLVPRNVVLSTSRSLDSLCEYELMHDSVDRAVSLISRIF